MKIQKDILQELLWLDVGDDFEGFQVVYKSKWESDGKYEHQQVVVQHVGEEKFYSYLQSRTGSYYTDYSYSLEWESDEVELKEVHRKEKTIVVWE